MTQDNELMSALQRAWENDVCDAVCDAENGKTIGNFAALWEKSRVATLASQSLTEQEVPILKGIGRMTGDGWKDATKKGEIIYVWNRTLPPPFAPGQYPRIGNEIWSATTEQYDFTPATQTEVETLFVAPSVEPAGNGREETCTERRSHLGMSGGYAQAAEQEAVAYTGSGSLMALKDGREGFIWPTPTDAHPIPLYATPPAPALDGVREALEAACSMLIRHHHWHTQQRAPDPEHGFIPADEYGDSALFEQTSDAIDKIDAVLAALSSPAGDATPPAQDQKGDSE